MELTLFLALPVVAAIVGGVYSLYVHHTDRLHRQRLDLAGLARLQPDAQGNYTAIVLPTGHLVQPTPGNILQPVPTSFNYAPHINSKMGGLPSVESQERLLEVGADADMVQSSPTFSELLAAGDIGRADGTILLGYSDGEPLRGGWKDLYSSAIAGVSGSGKTTTTRFLTGQAALLGARFVVIDPHGDADNDDSLARALAPLSGLYLCGAATDEEEITAALHIVHSELASRKRGGSKANPLVVCVDELTSLMRTNLAGSLSSLLQDVAQEGRKFNIFALAMGQIWKGSTSGGTELRDSFASFYVHRLKPAQARMLLPNEDARLVERLSVGQAMLFKTNGDLRPVNIPLTTSGDMVKVAGLLVGQTRQELTENYPEVNRKLTGIELKPADPADARIMALFRDGKDLGAIVRELHGDCKGATYQRHAGDVQAALRRAMGV